MRRFIIGFFAVIGFLLVLFVVGTSIAWHFLAPPAPTIAASTVLNLDLTRPIAETRPRDPVSRILVEEKLTLRDILDALQRAGDDPRVKGVVARLGNDAIGMATVQQLRDAVQAFRAKGKFAIAFADSFGEFGPGNRTYYLATAFDEVWLQPLGEVGLTGLRVETPFLRSTLDLLGIVPRLDHRSEYKSAMNTLTDTAMGAPQREELDAIVTSISGQMERDVASARHIAPADLRKIVDGGPYLAEEAKGLHLVDEVGYRDQAIAAARARAGGIAALIRPLPYLDRAGRPNRSGPTIALIYADGVIQRGDSEDNPLSGAGIVGSAAMARTFRSALADPDVRAILFRIDSPGGSAVASETIWRAAVRAREANIPVIVSMGDVAGSGGYYIAAGASKIVAEPATLTGSIGVVAGKMLTSGFWAKIGVGWGAVQDGKNAAMFSSLEDYTPEGKQRFEHFLDTVYAGFKQHVAEGRRLDKDTVEKIARGRVWTGEDAKRLGLVDALGGFETALRLARIAAHLDPDSPITLKQFPPEESLREAILDRLLGREAPGRQEAAGGGVTAEIVRSLGAVRPLLQRVEALTAPPGALRMPVSETPR